ncbi:MAG: YqaA family protein [Salinispira sp.]
MAKKQPPTLKKIIIQTLLFFLATFLVYILIIIFFPEEIQRLGSWAIDNFGLIGVFLFIYTVDTLIVPASGDLIFPFTMGWDPIPLLLTICLASIIGGISGFFIARKLSHLKSIQGSVKYYREQGEFLIRKYGIWAVVIAGLTPIPYSTVSWIAGIMNMPIQQYLLASLSRIPRFIVVYLLIQGGFNLAQGS